MSVKSRIENSEGIPVTQQHLIWQNDELDDHRRLRDYAICGGSTLRLVLGMRGGPLNAHRLPPLRLAPIQLNPSTSSLLSQLNRSLTFRGRPTRLPRLNTSGQTVPHLSYAQQTTTQRNLQSSNAKYKLPVDSSIQVSSDCNKSLNEQTSALLLQRLINDGGTSAARCTSSEHIDAQSTVDAVVEACPDICQFPSSPNLIADLDSLSIHNASEVSSERETQTRTLTTTEVPAEEKTSTSSIHSESPLGYPPLIKPSGIIRPPLTCDLASYCRLYEPHRITTYPKSFVLQNSFPILGAAESDSDSSPPGTASDRDSPRFDSRSGSDVNVGDDEFPILGSSASATALLAGFLPGPADRIGFSCQTSGNERSFNSAARYPYHWLKRASPFFENAPDLYNAATSTTAPPWESDEMCADALLTSFLDFRADHESDENPDEDEDDDSAEVRASRITHGMDDDDSLADLDDYLLYYRTGDLLFGPPSLTYPSYSYFTVCDPEQPDFKQSNTDQAHSNSSSSDTNLPQTSTSSTWQAERAQMVEKVNNLKNRMKELRIRRQSRQCTGEQALLTTTTTNCEGDSCGSCLKGDHESHDNSKQISCTDGQSNPDSLQTFEPVANPCSLDQPNNSTSCVSHDRQYRRRFGTITPPELSLLPSAYSNPPAHNSAPDTSSSQPHITIDPSDGSSSNLHLSLPSLTKEVGGRIFASRPSSTSCHPPAADIPSLFSYDSTQLAETSGCEVLKQSNLPSRPRLSMTTCRPSTSISELNFPYELKGSLPLLNKTTRLQSADIERARLHLRNSKSTMLKSTDFLKLPKLKSSKLPVPFDDKPHSPSTSGCQTAIGLVGGRRRCSLCLRKTGIVSSYLCRCGKNFCARHRYAESHTCSFDYKADGRRTLIETNPVVEAQKLPKI